MSDTQPPWGFLEIFRYLEEFGCVSVGSLYTFGLIGIWEVKPDGTWGPRTTPMEQGIEITDRDQALRVLADWNLSKPEWQHFYSPHLKSEMMVRIAKEWKLDGVMLHYNRGCEGLTRRHRREPAGPDRGRLPGDDLRGQHGRRARVRRGSRPCARIDSFMETLGLPQAGELSRREE